MVLGGYVLDTTKQPKQVTMFMRDDKKGAVLREEWHGIYSLESNRLTIAYRRGGPAPEKFEFDARFGRHAASA